MDYRDIQQLKAFFSALKTSGFKQDLKQIPSFAMVDGQRTPVDKAYCLSLLRSFPQFQGDKFKDDNAIIKYLSDPINRKFLLGNFTQAQQIELTKALEEKPVAVEEVSGQPSGQEGAIGEPPATMTGGGIPNIPPAPSIPSAPRVIRNIPHAPEPPAQPETPESKLYVANKSGTVVEERTITPTSSTVKKPEAPSKLYIANKSGTIVGERSIPPGPKFQAPKIPYEVSNAAKNLGSGLGRFTKLNSSRVVNGFGSLLGNIGGGAGRGILNIGFKTADFGARLSGQISGRGLSSGLKKGFGTGKKVAIASALFMMLFLGSLIAAIIPGSSTVPTVNASPLTSCDASGVDILSANAVTDESLNQFIARESVSPLVKKGTEQESKFSQRALFIRDNARGAGLNPAIFLGYWKSETHFSDYLDPRVRPGADLGCAPLDTRLTSFEESVFCAIGKSSIINSKTSQCALSRDINSSACQAISFQQKEGVKLPISTLKDFLDSYGSKVADPNNVNSDSTVKKVIGDLGLASCTFTTASGIPGTGTCPLTGSVKTTTGTKAYSEGSGGHCGQNYPALPWCSVASLNATQTSKASFAIDVSAGGQTDVAVVLPKINNENIVWTLHAVLPVTSIGGGLDFTGKNPAGTEYFLHLYHLAGAGNTITGFSNKTEFNSGETVSTQLYPLSAGDGGPHLHFTVAMRDTSGNWAMIEPNHDLHMCDGKGST